MLTLGSFAQVTFMWALIVQAPWGWRALDLGTAPLFIRYDILSEY